MSALDANAPKPKPSKEARMLAIFRRVHPELNVISNAVQCPCCKKRYYCETHHFASENWLTGSGAAMISAMAFRSQQLKKALEAEGFWP